MKDKNEKYLKALQKKSALWVSRFLVDNPQNIKWWSSEVLYIVSTAYIILYKHNI